MTGDGIQVRVRAVEMHTERIRTYELRPLEGATLPEFTAGAHVDLALPGGLVRSYSLLNSQHERHRYVIGVNHDEHSRGGSSWIHATLHTGDVLTIAPPRNNFALDEHAPGSVLVAGGIGITPVLGMVRRLAAGGRDWRLFYSARSRGHAAFLPELRELAGDRPERLVFHADDEAGRVFDMDDAVEAAGLRDHLYCCGPTPMLDAFAKATATLERSRVHVEHFTSTEEAATGGGFAVELARSGLTLAVPEGASILDTLLAAGLDVPYSCTEGICGTCETTVLSGTPDHRDMVLTDAEKEANDVIMVCCSGSLGPRLTLDR